LLKLSSNVTSVSPWLEEVAEEIAVVNRGHAEAAAAAALAAAARDDEWRAAGAYTRPLLTST